LLTHPTLDQLNQLGLPGMAQAFAELEAAGDAARLSHADWLGLLLDREVTHRRDKRLPARLRYARLRQHTVIEDVDYRAPRGLDRATRRAATTVRCSISGSPSCSPIWRWRVAMAAMRGSCAALPASSC
jgi:hypothetical protein